MAVNELNKSSFNSLRLKANFDEIILELYTAQLLYDFHMVAEETNPIYCHNSDLQQLVITSTINLIFLHLFRGTHFAFKINSTLLSLGNALNYCKMIVFREKE